MNATPFISHRLYVAAVGKPARRPRGAASELREPAVPLPTKAQWLDWSLPLPGTWERPMRVAQPG